MLPHHAEVFNRLVSQNPSANVYIATANKVEAGKSPFDAQEKISIMTQQHNIPEDRIIIPAGNNLYNKDAYAGLVTSSSQTALIFAVGQKDMEESPRFGFRPLKDGSDSYLQSYEQMINTNSTLQSMEKHGYVMVAPTIPGVQDSVASASAFRNALLSAPDLDSAKETYTKYMGEFNQEIFNLVYDKITGKIMKESLETLRKLAGLLDEAPVNFAPGKGTMDYEPGVSRKDQKSAAERPEKAAASNPTSVGFTKIAPEDMISVDTGKPINSRQRARSMANQFPDGADVNDPAVKKEMFLKLLAKSPGYVLGEINARLENDEDGFAVSDRLSNIIDNLPEDGIMGLEDEDRTWTLSLVQNAIQNMELHKKDAELDNFDDLEAEPEPEQPEDEPEMVSLDDPEFDAPEDELNPEMEEMKKLAGLKIESDEPKNCGCGKNPCETYGNPEEAIEEEVEVEVEEGKVPAGLQDYLDKKNGKKDDDADKDDDKEVDEDKDEDKEEVDEALNDMRRRAGLDVKEITEGGECFHCDGRGVHQDEDGEDVDCEKCDGSGYVGAGDDDQDEPGQDEIDANAEPVYKKYINKEGLDLSSVVDSIVESDPEGESVDNMSDEELHAYVGQKEEDLVQDMIYHFAPDYVGKDNFDERYMQYREEVLEPAAQDVSQDAADGMEPGEDYDSEDFVDNHNMVGDDEINQEESLDEFQQGEFDNDDIEQPDADYVLVTKDGKEIVPMSMDVPGLMRGTKLLSISPPTQDKTAHIITRSPMGKPGVMGQEQLKQAGLFIKPRGGHAAPAKQRTPIQPQLPGMEQPVGPVTQEESIDTAIDNALEETMSELKKLAGL